MDVGYSWTYEMLFQGQKGEQTIEVLGFKDGFFQDNQAGELKHTDDGLRDRARYLIKHPLAPGNTWKAIVSASAVERYRIDSVGERCESAAGAFEDCLVVTSQIRRDQDVTLHGKFTWAKGVGLVKMETEAEIKGKRVPQTRRSLLRYNQKGGSKKKSDEAPDDWTR